MTDQPGATSAVRALYLDYRKYAGWRLPLAILLMIAGSIAEGLGILMIVPIIAIATDSSRVPAQLAPLVMAGGNLSQDERFMLAIVVFLAAMAARSLLLYLRDMMLARLQAGHEASMQLRAAATLAGRGWPFASTMGQSGMQSLLLTEMSRAAIAVNYGQQALVRVIMLAVQVALIAYLSREMALIAMGIVLAGFTLSWRWVRKGSRGGFILSDAYEASAAVGFRLHAGLKAALAQGTVPQFLAEYRASLSRLLDRSVDIARDNALVRAAGALGSAVAAALILVIGDRVLELPFPVLVPLLVLFSRMSGPAQGLVQNIHALAVAAPAFAAIERRVGPLEEEPQLEAQPHPPMQWHKLTLDRVGYRHSSGLGIADASLSLAKGEWLGIGGDSGAGKTSLVDVIAGLMAPDSGTVSVDGRPLTDEALGRWRASLAYVGQGESVFDDTVRGNLLADGAANDDASLWSALAAVGLDERVRKLPLGLDQHVGDRGSSLSGGERQRLALARAVLRNPSLLILDEATGALDARTEETLIRNLRKLKPRPAALVVAHRPGVIERCDRKITISGGHVSEG